MSAINLTIKALLAQSTVTAITSTRIHQDPLKLGTLLPAIAVAKSSEFEERLLQGSSQYRFASVQIHCIAEEKEDADALGEVVHSAMRDLLYNNGNSPPSSASFHREVTDYSDYASNLSSFRRVVAYEVRWR